MGTKGSTQHSKPAEDKSPFLFLKNEKDEIIKTVHFMIRTLKNDSVDRIDKAIQVLVSSENAANYSKFKEEHKIDMPNVLASLSREDRQEIFHWFGRYYIRNAIKMKENSLDDILHISQKMLKKFEKDEGCEAGETGVSSSGEAEMKEVKAIRPLSDPVDTESYEKVDTNDCKEDNSPEGPPESKKIETNGSGTLYADADEGTPFSIQSEQVQKRTSVDDGKKPIYPALWSQSASEPPPQELSYGKQEYWDKYRNSLSEDTPPTVPLDKSNVTNLMEQSFNVNRSLTPPVNPASIDSLEYENSLNVMLIGGTGVGKTTFINAFLNYLKYSSLEEALQGGPIVPIRTSFDIIIEKSSKPVEVKIESSCNAAEIVNEPLNSKNGESRTQNAMIHNFTYTFHNQERMIRLVDTPGVMDTRGDEQDKQNYYNTMEIIKGLKRVHAIFVLLKPNDAKFTKGFEEALDKLLTHLPKTAVQNIAFCFTSTEPFNFKPSETYVVLEQYLKELKERTKIKIKASKENIFCFDSNCFRFQCTVQQFPEYKGKLHDYEKSWDNNVVQIQRMLEYLQAQNPYSVFDSVNIARVEKRLRNLVDTFAAIIKEHVKTSNYYRAQSKSNRGEYNQYKAELEEREGCFKYIIDCCSYFTDFLQRNAIGIEDLIGIKLQKIIMEEEKIYAHQRENKFPNIGETYVTINGLKRIVDYYRGTTKAVSKANGSATVEEIERILAHIIKLPFYGDKVGAADAAFTSSGSFRLPQAHF